MGKPLNSLLIKPAGPDCDLACDYCFYLEKAQLFGETAVHRMSDAVLEELMRQVFAQAGSEVAFGWQGGEPTLMGVGFFERAVELQKRFASSGSVRNGLQTNGLRIDESWIPVLRRNDFLVGLSLDGPAHVHDRYRRARSGGSTWSRVVDRAKLMLDAHVAVNALSVVNDYSVRFPEEIYAFHKELGLDHMQFIPVSAPFTLSAEAYGHFLCELFDLWQADFSQGAPTTSIRFFESLLYPYLHLPAPDCTLLNECGVYLVVEHNGDVFPCDFFVESAWKLGNVLQGSLIRMLNSERQREFGRIKSALPESCGECRWLSLCRGGCHKDRATGTAGREENSLCQGLKAFFEHADSGFRSLAEQWREDQAAQEMAYAPQARDPRAAAPSARVGRNAPCPCGSGLKFKRCCGSG